MPAGMCAYTLHKEVPQTGLQAGAGSAALGPTGPDTSSERQALSWVGRAGAWAVLPCPGGLLLMEVGWPRIWRTQPHVYKVEIS